MVSLAFGCLGFMLVGLAPFGVNNMGDAELVVRVGADVATVLTLALIIVCVFKGKFKLALFGIFVAPLAWLGALRLRTPDVALGGLARRTGAPRAGGRRTPAPSTPAGIRSLASAGATRRPASRRTRGRQG